MKCTGFRMPILNSIVTKIVRGTYFDMFFCALINRVGNWKSLINRVGFRLAILHRMPYNYIWVSVCYTNQISKNINEQEKKKQ